jgi:nitrite reductase (NO-forming)
MQFLNRHLFQIVVPLLVAVTLVACGGGNNEREGRNRSTNEQPASSAQQSAANQAAAGTTVNVIARDFEFNLDSNAISAGTTQFVLTNEGSMPHDFAITVNGERYKTEMLKPGESGSVTVELAAGSYEYICTVPGHDILGMKGTLTVN